MESKGFGAVMEKKGKNLRFLRENNTREVPDYNNEGTYYIKDNYGTYFRRITRG